MNQTSAFSYFSVSIFPLEKKGGCDIRVEGRSQEEGLVPSLRASPLCPECTLSPSSSGSNDAQHRLVEDRDSSSNKGQRACELGTKWSRVSPSKSSPYFSSSPLR